MTKKKKKFKKEKQNSKKPVEIIPQSGSTVPKKDTIANRTTTLPKGELPRGGGWELLLTDHNLGENLFVRTNNNIPAPIQVAQAMALEWGTLTTEEIVKRFTTNPIYVSEPHYLWDVLAYLMRSVPAAPTELIDGELVDEIVANHPLLSQLTWEKHDIKMLDIYIAKNTPKGVTISPEEKATYKKGYVKWMKNLPEGLLVMRGEVQGRVVNIEMARIRDKHGATRYHMAVRGPSLTEETEPYIHQWLRLPKVFAGSTNIRRRGTLENTRKAPVKIQGVYTMGPYIAKPKYMKRDWKTNKRKSEVEIESNHEDNVLDAFAAVRDNPGITVNIDDIRRG